MYHIPLEGPQVSSRQLTISRDKGLVYLAVRHVNDVSSRTLTNRHTQVSCQSSYDSLFEHSRRRRPKNPEGLILNQAGLHHIGLEAETRLGID